MVDRWFLEKQRFLAPSAANKMVPLNRPNPTSKQHWDNKQNYEASTRLMSPAPAQELLGIVAGAYITANDWQLLASPPPKSGR